MQTAETSKSDHASTTECKRADIADLLAQCAGAYSKNSLRGYATDLRSFAAWCATINAQWLPARPETVAAYIDKEVETLSAATLKRRVASINFAHRLRDLDSPASASVVRLALRRASRRTSRRPAQAKGLTSEVLRKIVDGLPDTLGGARDAALIGVGYDTLCRSAELAAMRIEHLREEPGGCRVLIPRSKCDVAGDGRIAWLSPETALRLRRWLDVSEVEEGPLFRALNLGRPSERGLDTCSIRRLIKRAATSAGVEPKLAAELSGHSMRVGAAQDMLVAGFDSLAIMQAGGWKTTAVLLRYVENASTQALHERRWRHRLETNPALAGSNSD